jgi:hypothetical protein
MRETVLEVNGAIADGFLVRGSTSSASAGTVAAKSAVKDIAV